DTATGEEVKPSLELEGDRPRRVAFGPPAGGLLATVDEGGLATFWNLDRRQRSISPAGHLPGPRVRDITFSPDLNRFITCSEEGELRWWDMTTLTPVGEPLWHRRGGCTTTALSLDGRTLVTGGQDRRILRWSVATGKILEPELLYDSPIEAIALTPNGQEIIAGTRAGGLHVWDADSGRGFDLPPQGTGITSLAVSPDGRLFASGTEGGIARLWDTSLLGQIGQTYKLDGAITSLAFDPGGRILAMGEEDGTIRLWEVPQQKALGPPLRVNHPVHIVTFGKDGEHLLIGSTEGTRWWDLSSHKAGEPVMHDEHELNRVEATAVSPDGGTLATARSVREGGRVRGWVELRDVATGARLRGTPEQPQALTGLAYSPNSKWLLTWGHEPGTARLWDVDTLQDIRLLQSLKSAIHQAAFSHDGGTLLLACRDHRARLWDLKRDVEIDSKLRPRHAYPITAVAFDPKRSRVVTGCHAGTVRVWDATEGRILTELRENAGEIAVLAFNRAGDTLLTASRDGTVRFLDAESARQLGPSLHHRDAVLCAAFHPDGQSVVTGTKDGMVQRWRVPPLPMTGSVGEIRRRLEQDTGLQLDEQGAVLPPDASEDLSHAKSKVSITGSDRPGTGHGIPGFRSPRHPDHLGSRHTRDAAALGASAPGAGAGQRSWWYRDGRQGDGVGARTGETSHVRQVRRGSSLSVVEPVGRLGRLRLDFGDYPHRGRLGPSVAYRRGSGLCRPRGTRSPDGHLDPSVGEHRWSDRSDGVDHDRSEQSAPVGVTTTT
ncbi:MAG: hypothetical protein WB773_04620, partial [Isosphaeraceae bacterium]